MGRIGKTYPRAAWANAEVVARVSADLNEPPAREFGASRVAGAIVLLLVLLGAIGWAFTL